MEEDYDPIVKFLRLKTGDDIIAEVIETGENDKVYYLLINPVKVYYMPTTKPGYMQVAFIPWVFSRVCDAQEFTISADDVLLFSNASEAMNEYYWKHMNEEEGEEVSEEETEPETQGVQEILEQLGLQNKRTYH